MPLFRLFCFLVSFLAVVASTEAKSAAITLSNTHIEVTVDAHKGLILGCNLPGEENLIWVNPKPVANPKRNNGWINYGGDKLWWGPMIDWMSVKGRRLPPDEPFDTPWEIVQQTDDSITIRSVVRSWVGIPAERVIRLSDRSAEVIIRNSFTRLNNSDQRLQLWTVTQVNPPLWCVLDSHPRPGESPYVNRRPQFDPLPYLSLSPPTKSVRYRYNEDGPNMIGTRGAWIAAVYADTIFVHEISASGSGDYDSEVFSVQAEAGYATDVSVQLFATKGFVELETLSSNASPAVGETMSNTVRWKILSRPTDLSKDQLSEWIRGQL